LKLRKTQKVKILVGGQQRNDNGHTAGLDIVSFFLSSMP
jgi:hypothetical protein